MKECTFPDAARLVIMLPMPNLSHSTALALAFGLGVGCGGHVESNPSDVDDDEVVPTTCEHPEAARSLTGDFSTRVALEPHNESNGCELMVCEVWGGHGLHLRCPETWDIEPLAECDFQSCVCEGPVVDGRSFSADFGTMQAFDNRDPANPCRYTITPL